MKYIFFFILFCAACVQAREYVCLELLNVDITFNQKNVPERFKFSFNDNVISSDVNVLYPIQKSVDYDGVVQLKSKDAIRTFHISYEDPGETKTLDSADVFPIKSLKGKVDSVAVADLWGTGDLFTKAFLYAEKMKSVRFLVPLLEKKKGSYVSVGYACTNWHDLREVEDPQKCVEKIKKEKKQKKKSSETGNSKIPSTKSADKYGLSPKFWDDVQNNIDLSDCYL